MWVVTFIYQNERWYYTGSPIKGQDSFTKNACLAKELSYEEAMKIADSHSADIKLKSQTPMGCKSCGAVGSCFSPYGDEICPGCGTGVTSPKYTGAKPIQNCSRCGEPIYNYDLFKGPVCPKCNHWC